MIGCDLASIALWWIAQPFRRKIALSEILPRRSSPLQPSLDASVAPAYLDVLEQQDYRLEPGGDYSFQICSQF
jgi:Protein of unknown function (DUF3146)